MNNFPIRPDEGRIEELLAKIQPLPGEGFHQKMKHAPWQAEGSQRLAVKNNRLKIAFALVSLVAVAMMLITPQGRAWAQEVVQFFTRINTLNIPLSAEARERMSTPFEQFELPLVKILTPSISPGMVGLPECENPQNAKSYACQIAYAESQLGFDLKEFPVQPDDWEMNILYFDPILKTAALGYKMDINTDYAYQRYSQFVLIQGVGDRPGNYFNRLEIAVPANKVQSVKVGSLHGEYVSGGFQLSSDGAELVWDDAQLFQRLAWTDDGKWYLIEYMPNLDTANSIQREQLLDIASSLVDKPVGKAASLHSDMLNSVFDAEELSGLDLKAPTLLPLGVDFSSARYFPASHEVHLQYGMNDELVIYEWEGKSINYDALLNPSNKDYAVVNVNGKRAFYGYSSGTMPYLFLSWRQDGLNYKMYFYQYLAYPGTLNKEKMIAIAESMSDINDYSGNAVRPYEYVSIYEQALGFNVKEFSGTPAGWLFTEVSAYPNPNCISMDYTAKEESGWLYVKQCSTDLGKAYDQYDIPWRAVTRVKIGKINGKYILGNPEIDKNGEIVWNMDLPYRRLLWQEKGIWIQLMLSGDSTLLYDKDDLIDYAESLR